MKTFSPHFEVVYYWKSNLKSIFIRTYYNLHIKRFIYYDLQIKRRCSSYRLTGHKQYFIALYQNRPHSDVNKRKVKASSELGWLNESNPEISLVTFNFAKHSFSFGFTEKQRRGSQARFASQWFQYFSGALNLCCVYADIKKVY